MKSRFTVWLQLAPGALALWAVTAAADTVSLAGRWGFALDRSDLGVAEKWFGRDLPDSIRLPGILQAQGYGDDVSIDTPWVLSLYDRHWFLRQEYAAYTNAGNVKVPFLSQPVKHYFGAAWYQRDFEIPAAWKGRRFSPCFWSASIGSSTLWLDATR